MLRFACKVSKITCVVIIEMTSGFINAVVKRIPPASVKPRFPHQPPSPLSTCCFTELAKVRRPVRPICVTRRLSFHIRSSDMCGNALHERNLTVQALRRITRVA